MSKCHQLKLEAADGKKYFTDVSDIETIFRLIQSVPSPKAEPIKLWLAKVGHERIQELADPERSLNRARENWQKHGRSQKWIQQRMMGQETRNKLTDYWSNNGIKEKDAFAILTNDKMSEILAELNQLRSIVKEQQTQIKYLSSLLKNVNGVSAESQTVLNNFITYGVDANTVKLGAGERAAVINSYKAAFDKLPTTEVELADAIKIANGRFPLVTSDTAEKTAKEQFIKIYKRAPDLANANDNAVIKVMAYGLRQKAENRNLNSEKAGIKTFKAIFGKVPTTTQDWNTMQAITYSGATR